MHFRKRLNLRQTYGKCSIYKVRKCVFNEACYGSITVVFEIFCVQNWMHFVYTYIAYVGSGFAV